MTRTLHESGTVVEKTHLDVSAPSARKYEKSATLRSQSVGSNVHIFLSIPKIIMKNFDKLLETLPKSSFPRWNEVSDGLG